MNTVVENFIVFNHLVSQKGLFGKKNENALQTHLLLTNIDRALAGQPAQMPVQSIVTEETYKRAMDRAKKAFDKRQFEVFDSQTPVYDP